MKTPLPQFDSIRDTVEASRKINDMIPTLAGVIVDGTVQAIKEKGGPQKKQFDDMIEGQKKRMNSDQFLAYIQLPQARQKQVDAIFERRITDSMQVDVIRQLRTSYHLQLLRAHGNPEALKEVLQTIDKDYQRAEQIKADWKVRMTAVEEAKEEAIIRFEKPSVRPAAPPVRLDLPRHRIPLTPPGVSSPDIDSMLIPEPVHTEITEVGVLPSQNIPLRPGIKNRNPGLN